MSGGSVPYHLRQNKAVERGVFVDTLLRVGRCTPSALQTYRYIGFAGPFSEDFKLAHAQLGISNFVSLEIDEQVHLRQQWNAPLKGIQYLKQSSGDFIDTYDADHPSVVWLDYADPKKVEAQLNEVQALVSKLADYDVLKVTLNASHGALGHDPNNSENTIQKRIERARQRLGKFLPDGLEVTAEDVDRLGFPSLLLKAVEIAVKRGMQGNASSRFQLLTTFTYADSEHKILTVCGLILPDSEVTSFLRQSGIAKWGLAITKWGAHRTVPIDIAVPEMSLRERLYVDQQLPRRSAPRVLMKRLGFQLGGKVEADTIKALGSYSTFYRYFPYFSKMIV